MAKNMREFLRTRCENMLQFEQQVERLHSDLIKNAENVQVSEIMRWHMKQLGAQITNMSGIVESMGGKTPSAADPVVQAISQEFQSFLQSTPSKQLVDIYIMQLAQRISTEKIVMYRALNDIAHLLGDRAIIQKLARNQADEERMLSRLNDARRSIITQLSIPQRKAA